MVRTIALILAVCGPALARPGIATPQMLARDAFVTAPHAGQGCVGSHLMSHAAYVPGLRQARGGQAMQCGQLLSTDTLLTGHRWDRT